MTFAHARDSDSLRDYLQSAKGRDIKHHTEEPQEITEPQELMTEEPIPRSCDPSVCN